MNLSAWILTANNAMGMGIFDSLFSWVLAGLVGIPTLVGGLVLAFFSVRRGRKADTNTKVFLQGLMGGAAVLLLSVSVATWAFIQSPALGDTATQALTGLVFLLIAAAFAYSASLYLRLRLKTGAGASLALAIVHFVLAGLILLLGLTIALG